MSDYGRVALAPPSKHGGVGSPGDADVKLFCDRERVHSSPVWNDAIYPADKERSSENSVTGPSRRRKDTLRAMPRNGRFVSKLN